MKKFGKVLLAVMTTAALSAALVGCGDDPTTNPTTDPTTNPTTEPTTEPTSSITYGIGYGMVHGAGYIGRATITMEGDDVLDVTWDEACLPTYVTAGEEVPAEDKVTVIVNDHGSDVEKSYYKTVKFADVTMTYDAEATTYKVGDVTMIEWFQDEANCKTYYDAVFASRVAVVVGGEEDTTVLDALSLLKSHNGYWSTGTLGYRGNYDATVKYIIENDLDAIDSLERDPDDKMWYDENDVCTGATWTDLNTDKENTLSYVQLVKLAASHAVEAKVAGAYGMVHGAGYVAGATLVENADGEVIDVAWNEACLPTYVTAGEEVSAEDKVTVIVNDHGNDVEKSYYKTVKVGDVTMTYDAEKASYMVGDATLVEWLQDEANAETYYKAALASEIAVVVGGEEDTTVLTAKALMKDQNGYWTTGTLGYWGNYGKTVEYFVTYGLDAAASLERDPDDKMWYDENDVCTGATWTDLNTDKENTLSYVQLVLQAAEKIG